MDQAVLPRSFLFYLSQRLQLPTADVWSFSHLFRPLENLVEAIYSGQSALKLHIYHCIHNDSEKTSSGISNFRIVDESSLACKPEYWPRRGEARTLSLDFVALSLVCPHIAL